jgi:hypothetical protein
LFGWLRRHYDAALFALGVALLVFLAGMAVGRAGLFPYPLVHAAKDAVDDLQANWRHYLGLRSKYLEPTTRTAGGVTIHDKELAFDGLTFVAAHREGAFDAWLLDMDGRPVHRWDASFGRIWPDPGHVDAVGWDGSVEIHGAHLEPNGDVLLALGGAGTVKLDRCSNVLWTVDQHTHHHVEPLPDGGAVMPSRIKRFATQPDRPLVNPGPNGFYWDDTVLLVDANGKVQDEQSVIDILYRSGWASALLSAPNAAKAMRNEDPIHLNDVEVLSEALAPAFPMFAAGDLLLSLRHTNALVVIDPKSWRAKWVAMGPFLGQHDPDFLPNGRILVYDNRITGKTPRFGNTRLVEIDPATREVTWSWEGQGEQAFYNESRGEQAVLPNGNILISDSHHGRVLEITPSAGGRTVWEWVNLVEPGLVGLVTDVERVPRAAAPWLGQPCFGGGTPVAAS